MKPEKYFDFALAFMLMGLSAWAFHQGRAVGIVLGVAYAVIAIVVWRDLHAKRN